MPIDPELRDKIIETHTMVKGMDKAHDEYKRNMNGRLKGMHDRISDNHAYARGEFEKHGKRISKGEHFRTRVIAYASTASIAVAFVLEFAMGGIKKIIGL